MDELKNILEKINTLEARLNKLEDTPENIFKTKSHHYTISPDKMDVGRFAYVGNYQSDDGSMGSTFGADSLLINKLFDCPSFEMAKVIDAFSSEDRIDIVKQLVKQSLTARQLMDILKFQTTGKLYHHLSFLEKIGVIRKDSEHYHVSAKFISCVVLIFAGVEKIVKNSATDK